MNTPHKYLWTMLTKQMMSIKSWSWREESNPRPADYKSAALPTELRQQISIKLTKQDIFSMIIY